VTCLGVARFGDQLGGGVFGLLGALVLLVVRPPRSWWPFGLVTLVELSLWLPVGRRVPGCRQVS